MAVNTTEQTANSLPQDYFNSAVPAQTRKKGGGTIIGFILVLLIGLGLGMIYPKSLDADDPVKLSQLTPGQLKEGLCVEGEIKVVMDSLTDSDHNTWLFTVMLESTANSSQTAIGLEINNQSEARANIAKAQNLAFQSKHEFLAGLDKLFGGDYDPLPSQKYAVTKMKIGTYNSILKQSVLTADNLERWMLVPLSDYNAPFSVIMIVAAFMIGVGVLGTVVFTIKALFTTKSSPKRSQ